MNIIKIYNFLLPFRTFQKKMKVKASLRSISNEEHQKLNDFEKQVASLNLSERKLVLDKVALYWAAGWTDALLMDCSNIIDLMTSGYEVKVICPPNKEFYNIFKLLGVKDVFSFEDNWTPVDDESLIEIYKILDSGPLEDFYFDYKGFHLAKYALSSFFRITRRGDYKDLDNGEIRLLKKCLFLSALAIEVSTKIIDKYRPDLVVGSDRGYTPQAELFSVSLNKSIPFVTWNVGHKNNTFIFKRYFDHNKSEHPFGLSATSWNKVMSLGSEVEDRGMEELISCYRDKSWFKEVGTQINTREHFLDEIKEELGLGGDKKVVCLFPHIFWDATFFWGDDLFDNYQDWFEAVCKVAKEKVDLNWLIKIHPCNQFKNKRDGYNGNFQELDSLNKVFQDKIPDHIKIIEPDSSIQTLDLIKVIDYCLTVRGTVGLEAAAFGKRVLTCGTGRYDRLGFTKDFISSEEYLNTLKRLEEVPDMSKDEVSLARKFLFGTLISRVYSSPNLNFDFMNDDKASLVSSLSSTISEDETIKLFLDGKEEDFLKSL